MSAFVLVCLCWLLLSVPAGACFGKGLTVCDRRDRQRRELS